MSEREELDRLVAVSNTGPLISALQCDGIAFLKRYFSVVYISGSELAEFEKHGWIEDIRRLIREDFIVVIEELTEREHALAENIAKKIARDVTSQDPVWRNHLPEAEAMALMQQRPQLMIGQILLDEKAARQVAQELGLSLTGFPGVLGRAGLDGVLTREDIRRLLMTCRQQGTHYGEALIDAVAQTYGR